MALYLDKRVRGLIFGDREYKDYGLFSSSEPRKWEKLCNVTLHGDTECPEFFEMAVDGNRQNTPWIFYGASGVI